MIANEQKNEPEVLQQAVPSHEIKQLTKRLHALEEQLANMKNEGVQQAPPKEQRKPMAKQQSTFKVPHEQIRTVLDNAGKAEIVKVRNEWANFLEQLKAANPQAHATIQHTNPAAASNDALIVAFKYEIHCSLFMDHKSLAESILANVLSNHVRIIPIPEENWLQVREDYIQNKGKSQSVDDEGQAEEEGEVEQ